MGKNAFPQIGLTVMVAVLLASGCGTTRLTDTKRTATEQLLLSDAIDRAVDRMDLTPLEGEAVYFNSKYLGLTTDELYTASTIRQKLLASGCALKDKPAAAKYIVEARTGGIGTDRHELTFGIPAIQVPAGLSAMGLAPIGVPNVPEVPLVKKNEQRGVAKIALYAFDRESGEAYWQSGSMPVTSTAKGTWVFGAGPFQWGTIYDGPKFAGGKLPVPFILRRRNDKVRTDADPSVTATAVFLKPVPAETGEGELDAGKVELVDHVEPVKDPPKPKKDVPKPKGAAPKPKEPAAKKPDALPKPAKPSAKPADAPPKPKDAAPKPEDAPPNKAEKKEDTAKDKGGPNDKKSVEEPKLVAPEPP